MGTGKFNAGGSPAMDKQLIQGGLEMFLGVSAAARNRDNLRPDGPLGPYGTLLPCLPTSFNYLSQNVYA